MTGVSGLLITRNASASLGWALGSLVPWVDEIVVVDMDSDDGTQDLARSHGARVVPHDPVGYADPARPFGVTCTTQPWVIMLDSDEMVPRALSEVLLDVARRDTADAVRIPMVNYAMGGPCVGGPLAPTRDRHLRFFKRDSLTLRTEPHTPPHMASWARVLELPARPGECLEHFAHLDLSDLLQRADRYTTIQARQDLAAGVPPSTWHGVRRAGRQFLGGYVKHKGYRDGWRGFHTSAFFAYYELIRQGKLAQLSDVGDADEVRRRYQARADELLAHYTRSPR